MMNRTQLVHARMDAHELADQISALLAIEGLPDTPRKLAKESLAREYAGEALVRIAASFGLDGMAGILGSVSPVMGVAAE